jgi:hypothetical protein
MSPAELFASDIAGDQHITAIWESERVWMQPRGFFLKLLVAVTRSLFQKNAVIRPATSSRS